MRTAIALSVLLVGVSPGQETPKEATQPTFRAQTDVVVVPFQVRRGSRPVSDLESSDVVLLEDGRPREVAGFEAPSDRPSLELVVMFDVTDVQRGGFWSARALRELASFWNEATMPAIVEAQGAGVRISLYQFNESRLRRLTRSTSDPKVLLDALHRLSDPMPADPALDLTLPAGTVIRSERSLPHPLGHPWPLSLAGAMTALQDSALGLAMGARALVIVSTGAEGTSIRPEDLADQALSADVHVYPVALPSSTQAIWYEGDNPNVEWEYLGASGPSHVVASRLPENGICQDSPRRGRPPLDPELLDCPLNQPFKAIGNWTGGRSFEAARRAGPIQHPIGIDRFSMTGAQVVDILDAVKEHALARFTATYRVWFTPSPSASPRKHTLEVKLAPKSSGKVSGGKKNATY
jgi:hypothetical protein